MQNIKIIEDEIRLLIDTSKIENFDIVLSNEKWNPISSLIIRDFTFPQNILPSKANIRIPFPNLYGFSSTNYIMLIDSVLKENIGGQYHDVPFCLPITEAETKNNVPLYVDFREKKYWEPSYHYLCIAPETSDRYTYSHLTISQFIYQVEKYLQSPSKKIQHEIIDLKGKWKKCKDYWVLIRLSYLYYGLGEIRTSIRILKIGLRLFPKNNHLKISLDRYLALI